MRKTISFQLGATVLLAMSNTTWAQGGFFDKLKGSIEKATTQPQTQPGSGGGLAQSEIVAGLREALRVGSERVVALIGKADGYNGDPQIHIPLPGPLKSVQSTLGKFGMSGLMDDVELKLNRAAEAAAPKTKELILKAISDMTLKDAQAIYQGPEDGATQYFKRTASPGLKGIIRPVVEQTLNEVGAIASYDKAMSAYGKLPFVPDIKADLTRHTVDLALAGLFHYLAREEAAIRRNPAKRTTEILARVFGG